MKFSNKWSRRSKVIVFLAGLAPAMVLVWRGLHQQLGANPIETVTHVTGDWTLRFLLITLLITRFADWRGFRTRSGFAGWSDCSDSFMAACTC